MSSQGKNIDAEGSRDVRLPRSGEDNADDGGAWHTVSRRYGRPRPDHGMPMVGGFPADRFPPQHTAGPDADGSAPSDFAMYRTVFKEPEHNIFLAKRAQHEYPLPVPAGLSPAEMSVMQQRFVRAFDRKNIAAIFSSFVDAVGKDMISRETVVAVQDLYDVKKAKFEYKHELMYLGTVEYGRFKRGDRSVHQMVLRLANNGFLYKESDEADVKRRMEGFYHHCEGWEILKLEAVPDLQPLFDFANAWFHVPDGHVNLSVRYNWQARRLDVACTNTKLANVELKMCFEPGYPIMQFDESCFELMT
eukprot:m.433852 g.433852  ORF g.433852 m.433852 type:complete len:304 (-) comp17631_c0_seq1:73-984(-)